jgi:hypothetical protein
VKARARSEQNHRALTRITRALETAQKDLGAIRGSLGTGAGDLRKDVGALLRAARRDVAKMNRAVRADLERLQKDVSSAARAKPTRAPRKTSSARARSGGRGRGRAA